MMRNSKNLSGIAFIILAMFCYSLQDLAVKWIGGRYPIMEIILVRSLVGLPCTLLFFRSEGRRGLPTSPQRRLEYLRGIFLFLSFTTYVMGVAALPLGDSAAIRNSGPLMITLLSVIWLREQVGLRRWLALLVGFTGVLLVVQPGSAAFNLGSIFSIFAALFYALTVIITRRLQTTDSSATMAYHSSLVFLTVSLALGPLGSRIGPLPQAHPSIAFLFHPWSLPGLADGAILCALGLVWASAMFCVARAYSLADASLVAPFEYVMLPINVLWGLLVWGNVPTLLMLAGSTLTLLSGIYLLNLDRRNAQESHPTSITIQDQEIIKN